MTTDFVPRRFSGKILIFFVLLLVIFPVISNEYPIRSSYAISTSSVMYTLPPYLPNYTALASSLISTYNSTVGLVYESNEGGNSTGGRPYNQTYWINNDNELAAWALWNNTLLPKSDRFYSANISATIQKYNDEYNLTAGNFYQVFWGVPLSSSQIQNNNNYVLHNMTYALDDEIHNSSTNLIYQDYSNTLIVHCLNNYIEGNITGSIEDFTTAMNMWNGQGINDTANNGNSTGYADYKIAAVLFAAQVLNVNIASNSNLSKMQQVLWNNFLPGLGIKTGYGGGHDNSTNTEASAFTLMAYNKALIRRVQLLQRIKLSGHGKKISMKRNAAREFNIEYVSGGNQIIILENATELPSGISLTNNITYLSYGQFNIAVNLTTTLALPGTYPILLYVTGQDGWSASYLLTLTVRKG